jgi:hypothetical protein
LTRFGIGYIAGPAYVNGGCYVTRRVMTPYGYRLHRPAIDRN